MSFAQRLAHRDGVRPSGRAPSQRIETAARTQSVAEAPAVAKGFAHDAIEVPVDPHAERPAGLGTDLRAIALPTAPALAKALGTLARLPAAGPCPRRPAVMLDLETTGLLGQPGAVVGVAGAAWHVAPDRVRVEQWSLARVGAEAAMLAHLDAVLRAQLGPRTAIVTFNGASFDLPLLRRRMVRHGIYGPTDDPLRAPHVDLLPPARRLWRDRGPDCRLGTLELRQLQLDRREDVSGAEVVDLLWRWLEQPDASAAADLARVQRHNRIDVLSLAVLAQTMHARLQAPVDAVERLRAARHLDKVGRPEPALAVLRPLLEELARPVSSPPSSLGSSPSGAGGPGRRGTRAQPGTVSLAVDAGMLAAEIERRCGRRDRAARLWARVCRRAPGHPLAHEALAKHLEHRARDLAAALAVAAASVTPCARRVARLRDKLDAARDAKRVRSGTSGEAAAATGPLPVAEAVVDVWARGPLPSPV